MKLKIGKTWFAALAMIMTGGLGANAQASYAFHDLGTMGGTSIAAYGVNSSGQAVGGYVPAGSSSNRVFLYLPTSAYGLPAGMNDIGTIGSSIATAVNDSGEVVGRDAHAFIWVPNARYGLPAGISDINVLPQISAAGFVAVSAYSINNNHVVAGTAKSLADNSSHGFVFDLNSGVYTDLGSTMTVGKCINSNPSPQVVGSQLIYNFFDNSYTSLSGYNPMGINNAGEIAATAFVSGNYHAFYRSPSGQWTNIGWLGYASARVDGINNAGVNAAVIVGYSYTSQLLAHAFRWRAGSSAMDDLNKISTGIGKFTLVEATAVGDGGHIVGYATIPVKGGNAYHAFLLTPQ